MANSFIDINITAGIHAIQLRSFMQVLRQAYDQGLQIRDKMNCSFEAPDFSGIESRFGIPAGKGQEVFDGLNGVIGVMDGTFQIADAVKNFTSKVG